MRVYEPVIFLQCHQLVYCGDVWERSLRLQRLLARADDAAVSAPPERGEEKFAFVNVEVCER